MNDGAVLRGLVSALSGRGGGGLVALVHVYLRKEWNVSIIFYNSLIRQQHTFPSETCLWFVWNTEDVGGEILLIINVLCVKSQPSFIIDIIIIYLGAENQEVVQNQKEGKFFLQSGWREAFHWDHFPDPGRIGRGYVDEVMKGGVRIVESEHGCWDLS